MDFGPKFDLSDVEDEDEFGEHKKTKKFESCRDFVLIDKEVNNEVLKILSTHSNEVSIQSSIQESIQKYL